MFFPTISWALTSYDSQPEIYGYRPGGNTDNVNLVNGKFNYNVEVTSIPEFPMNVGYSSGLGMDEEASWFGFGFNGFTGAIGRNMLGLPDDLKNGARHYSFSNTRDWSASLAGTISAPVFAQSFGVGGVAIGPSLSFTAGYNNLRGVFCSLGFALFANGGFGISQMKGAGVGGGLAASLVSDSRNDEVESGLSFGAGIGYSLYGSLSAQAPLLSGYKSFNTSQGNVSSIFNLGTSLFSSAISNTAATLPSSPILYPPASSFGVSLTLPLPYYPSISITGAYNQSESGNGEIDKGAMGFMHLGQYDRRSRNQIADYSIEGEDSYSDKATNSPAYMQRDFFSINTMGMSGTMQLYQEEYGVVSRNYSRSQHRDISLFSINTDRQEVYPWTNVSQTKFNKSIDILSLLKKSDNPEDKDFDNFLFKEEERASLTTDKYKFGNAEFKMRGDMAGEYNQGSTDFKDKKLEAFDLIHVSGSGSNPSFSFLGHEKDIALYYPNVPSKVKNGKFERGTQIKKHTINEILSNAGSLTQVVVGNKSVDNEAFSLSKSMYCHNTIGGSEFNLFSHLNNIKTGIKSAGDLIGSIDVQSTNGMRYYFGLPVFNKKTTSVQLKGKGISAPGMEASQPPSNYKTASGLDFYRTTTSDNFAYPYAWLLTAIVGEDYIDFDNVPGPSDGDLGYWVKFKYIRTADNYKWRSPFASMQHFPGAINDDGDDCYSATSGEKEIYYVSEIESSEYICKYSLAKRYDGFEAAGLVNGNAFNSLTQSPVTNGGLGNNSLYLVTRIDLYKKRNQGDNSNSQAITNTYTKPIKSTIFKYDYSTSADVPNAKDGGSGYSYYYADPTYPSRVTNGKATLRMIQNVAYDDQGQASYLPPYRFNYWGNGQLNNKYNPSYDRNAVDQWGNYIASAKKMGTINTTVPYYQHYTELAKNDADESARAFNLSQIVLPSGGVMNIDYQAQAYSKVQDQSPYVMRKLIPGSKTTTNTDITVQIDVHDLGGKGLQEVTSVDGKTPLHSVGDVLYGEIAYYQASKSPFKKESELYIASEEAKIKSFGSVTLGPDNRYYQSIVLTAKMGTDTPFRTKTQNYMYTSSKYMRAVKEANSNSCGAISTNVDKYESLEKDDLGDALKKMINNIGNIFKNNKDAYQTTFKNCIGEPATDIFNHMSFIRTNVYKGKYTGSVVKSIKLSDSFNYSTEESGKRSNVYGTDYFYDDAEDGSGVASGVATVEPGGGKSCVIDILATEGSGYMPSPAISHAKVTVRNAYKAPVTATTAKGDIVSRDKGKTVYTFYSANEPGIKFKENKFAETGKMPGVANGHFYMFGIWGFINIKFKVFGVKVLIQIPIFLPATINWNRADSYHVRSHSYTDYTDIIGRPKTIIQKDASDKVIGQQKYNYYGLDETVPMFDGNFNKVNMRPGKMDQVWSEAYYVKKSQVQLIPWILYLQAKTNRDYSFTSMKYSYVPPVLKEVESTFDGMKTVTKYNGFDYYTGAPLEVQSNDSYGNTKFVRTLPAYWMYPEMGPGEAKGQVFEGYSNNLEASAGVYSYLNTINNNHLTDVNITQWTKSDYAIADYLQPNLQKVDGVKYRYAYTLVEGKKIKEQYDAKLMANDKFIKRNATLYKPYKKYTYETSLNTDGTYASFADFNYSGSNTGGWKCVSTDEIYSHHGVVLQMKDILGKYVSQQLGYNFANNITNTSNGSYSGSTYDGAENTYLSTPDANSATTRYLENNRVSLGAAQSIKKCVPTFLTKPLDINEYPSIAGHSNARNAMALSFNADASTVYDKPLAKLDVCYKHNPDIKRSLYVFKDHSDRYYVTSNYGEDFGGFFYLNESDKEKLFFNGNDFQSIQLDNNFNMPVPCTFSAQAISVCPIKKPYKLPLDNCFAESHSGEYVFELRGENNIGTTTQINPAKLPIAERNAKFKAMVWVHKSSGAFSFTIRKTNATGKTLGSLIIAREYLSAGSWSLYRADFDLAQLDQSKGEYYEVYMKNKTIAGSVLYDDIRVLPYYADMTNTSYDHTFNRPMSVLDKDHFAGHTEYDSRGRVIKSSVEIQDKGVKTIQKTMYNDQVK